MFLITFDSGAECSLIRESVSNKLVGKRIHSVISLKGIGTIPHKLNQTL